MRLSALGRGRDFSVEGSVICPPDKSITHRSLMFAAMAQGESKIVNALTGQDCMSTLQAFQAMGVDAKVEAATITILSPGMEGWRSPRASLDFGNSGTTARLMLGLLAARPGLECEIVGDASLSERPMGRVVGPLRKLGARIEGRDDGNLLPLRVYGAQLRAGRTAIHKATAQVKSAMLLAGLSCEGETEVELPTGSRDHTEKMLQAMGADCTIAHAGHLETIRLRGPFVPAARRFHVPGDPSSAAFFAVLAAIAGRGEIRIESVLDNPTRCGFLQVLEAMGVSVQKEVADHPDALEPMRHLVIHGGAELHGIEVPAELIPTLIDEVPVLCVAAAFAVGETRFRQIDELRVKESNRLIKSIELIQAAGGEAYEDGDDLVVRGFTSAPRPFAYDPAHDHRMAMAAAILAMAADGDSQIADAACVSVSFPSFFDVLAGMR